MKQRLQKIIAAAGYCSRRRAETLIAAGRVRVDGQIVKLGDQADAEISTILIDDKPLKAAENLVYVLLNKPLGTVTTLSDPEGRPVVSDLVRDLPVRLFPVGRLDINASGLLLMTNDGALANRLAHPSHQVDKIYLVKVRGRVTAESKMSLEKGVVLDDGLTAPAKVVNLRVRGSHTWFELTIHEGRNRQVRRMCEVLGHQVNRLVRIGYAFLTLDDLAPGRKRMLTAQEVSRLKRLGDKE
ncbi:MAG: rRNA pseudouridine synthase [Deltaproteobacteria bacterium]|nr:rRNA pseudouridine synthase [Deltaproteobacteria bacterium]